MIATALFVEGGDQTRYVEYWGGTALQAAMQSHVDVHPIGGTSAGMHLMGGTIYTPPLSGEGISSDEALRNPNSPYMHFSGDFYGIGLLSGVVTDTHFRERDRMGRTLAFLAQSSANKAIMADEGTALLIEVQGEHASQGRVVGGGAVYFARNDNAPSVASPNKLSLGPTQIQRIRKGAGLWDQYFSFGDWSAHGEGHLTYTLTVTQGQIVANYGNGNSSNTNYYGDAPYANL